MSFNRDIKFLKMKEELFKRLNLNILKINNYQIVIESLNNKKIIFIYLCNENIDGKCYWYIINEKIKKGLLKKSKNVLYFLDYYF